MSQYDNMKEEEVFEVHAEQLAKSLNDIGATFGTHAASYPVPEIAAAHCLVSDMSFALSTIVRDQLSLYRKLNS